MIILITGASGSGKTTVLKAIEQKLPTNQISVNYFDDIGVPSSEAMIAEYGSCEKWQEAMTHKWMEKLATINDKEYIFLEGSFNPEFAKHYSLLICIHAEKAIREERLIKQRNQPELVTEDMENFAQMLKSNTLKMGGIVIDSSMKKADIIAGEIIDLILVSDDKRSSTITELYHQAENYFFNSISTKCLNLDDAAICYMTSVPVADLNIVYIKKHPSSLDKILNSVKLFYGQADLGFIVIIPEELCATEIDKIFEAADYFQTDKSVAMAFDLKNLIINNVTNFDDGTLIKASDNKLEDWLVPMTAFSATDYEMCIKYADTHKLALERNSKLHHFSLYREEKPIASITLSLNNDIARIDDVGTLPEFQGKGYATRLMNYALSEARKLGAIYCFLESSDSGLSIYQKLGFKTLFKNNVYSRKE